MCLCLCSIISAICFVYFSFKSIIIACSLVVCKGCNIVVIIINLEHSKVLRCARCYDTHLLLVIPKLEKLQHTNIRWVDTNIVHVKGSEISNSELFELSQISCIKLHLIQTFANDQKRSIPLELVLEDFPNGHSCCCFFDGCRIDPLLRVFMEGNIFIFRSALQDDSIGAQANYSIKI